MRTFVKLKFYSFLKIRIKYIWQKAFTIHTSFLSMIATELINFTAELKLEFLSINLSFYEF